MPKLKGHRMCRKTLENKALPLTPADGPIIIEVRGHVTADAPIILQPHTVGADAHELTWKLLHNDAHPPVTEYRKVGDPGEWMVSSVSGSTFSVTLTPLQPNSQYQVEVKGHNTTFNTSRELNWNVKKEEDKEEGGPNVLEHGEGEPNVLEHCEESGILERGDGTHPSYWATPVKIIKQEEPDVSHMGPTGGLSVMVKQEHGGVCTSEDAIDCCPLGLTHNDSTNTLKKEPLSSANPESMMMAPSTSPTQPLNKPCFSICCEAFSNKTTLKAHTQKTTEHHHHCEHCGKRFTTANGLRRHRRVHTSEKPHRCADCGTSFSQKDSLRRHQRIHTRERPYHCGQCGKSFAQAGALQLHQRIHTGERPYQCGQCGKSFSRATTLREHQKIHTGQKSHQCAECGKCFSREDHLRIHQRIHAAAKPYQCLECGKGFSQLVSLTAHQHIHTGEKPYHCGQCGEGFSTAGNLLVHQRIHTGDKIYNCHQCGKSFSTAGNLRVHQRIHTGDKPFNCQQCWKGFSTAGNLSVHQRVHTGEKPYLCGQCGKTFSTAGNLRKHQQIHTSDKG